MLIEGITQSRRRPISGDYFSGSSCVVFFRTPIETRNATSRLEPSLNVASLFFLFADIRLQLNEQLRCLDVRMEAQVALVAELQDFFRRRAELELDYSKSLDKMARSIQLRHKEQKQKYVTMLLVSSKSRAFFYLLHMKSRKHSDIDLKTNSNKRIKHS